MKNEEGGGSVSSRYRIRLISPTGGFYRLQPPSDTRLVVKISDAPWAGERGRAVNRCRLIEHIHVRFYPSSYTYIHIYICIDLFFIQFTIEKYNSNIFFRAILFPHI